MKSLNAQLLAFKSSVFERADAETAEALRQLEAESRAEVAGGVGLKVGDRAPDFTLKDSEGSLHSLASYVSQGPVFVIFFKGSWCPYSSLTLRAWEDRAGEIRRAGGRILALSPQKPQRIAVARESNGVSFPILADCGNKTALAFGVSTQVKPAIRPILAKVGCSLPEENSSDVWALPRAAEFLVGRDGIIHMAHVSPVYFERLEPREAVDALRKLQAEALTHA
ncbi:peroxiredoxin-like family protein [Acidisoma sp. 7E03]